MTMPSPYVDIPPELTGEVQPRIAFERFLRMLQQQNPMGLYQLQLADYYRKQVESGLKVTDAAKQYGDDIKEAEARAQFGLSADSLPHYKDLATDGASIQSAYQDYLAAEEDAISQIKRKANTPAGQQALDQAVQEGRLSEQEAFFDNPTYQNYINDVSTKYRETQATDKERLLSGAYSNVGRQRLQQAVAEGTLTQAEAFDNNPYWKDYQQQTAQGQANATETQANAELAAGQRYKQDAAKASTVVERGMAANAGVLGQFGKGNIDLTNRPRVQNPDGSVSTVLSKSFNFDGQEVLLPTVSEDGRIMSDQEAIDQYLQTGKHLGKFSTPDEANQYAQQLHESQATNPGMSQQEAQTVFGQGPVTAGKSSAAQTLENLILEGRKQGIDTTQAEDTYRQLANRGTAGDQGMASASQALNAAITQQKQGQRSRQAAFLQQQYPDEYKAWADKTMAGYGNTAPQGWESGFTDWVNGGQTDANGNPLSPTPEQTAFQQKRKDTELSNWQKYGDIYGAYQDALSKATDYTPIDQWIENTPQVKVAWERRQPRVPRQPFAQWR